MGRRFKGPLKKVNEAEIPENDEQEDNDSIKTDAKSNIGSADQDGEEDYYHEEEYPEEKYRQLEERMKAMEIQKIQPHTEDKRLWIHFFQQSLSGTQLEWYYQLESANICTWEDMAAAFYKHHLLGSSSSGFTDLILNGERVESGIRSGKIHVGATSGTTKKPYHGRNESNAVHSQRGRNKNDQNQSVGVVLISAPTPQQTPREGYQRRSDPPRSPGHHADNCWALKNKIQDMIDAGEIEFDPLETPNVITAPMPNHDKAINTIMDTVYVNDVRDLSTPLPVIKRKLLQAGLFPGCDPENLCEGFSRGLKIEDMSVISKAPFKISTEPRVAPVTITKPGPIPYSSDKAIPWNYGAEVYIQGVKQELVADKVVEDTNLDVGNITGTSKVTRSGRVFSPEISPNSSAPTGTPIPNQNADTRGKRPLLELVQTPVGTVTTNPSPEEANEFLKITRKSDYDIVEQMGHTPSKISMLSLLNCSKTHAKAMMKFLEASHVPQEISVTQIENFLLSVFQ
ncbi:uncharacterized protein LOC131638901 [Vicia villosa]|uniref:uncharacterized protein LOC131638901 n=1 Tax=Vicia villosa TaxID=3911 RepID=UPI00273B8ED1|nr:uncharacterized protein LOC131638901 [Vicia villosa]